MKLTSKLFFIAAIVAMLATGLGSTAAFAQGAQPSYTSGVQVSEISGSTATVNMQAYNADGSSGGSGSYTINGGESITLFPLADVSTGFSGSLVFSSDKELAAIANVLASDFSAGASYVGRSSGATSVQLPLLNKGNSGFNTWFAVQNANGSGNATVDIAYSDGTSAPQATIPANSPKFYYQAQETHSAATFAGTVTSDVPVVAAVIQESDSIMFAYTAFTGGDPNPVFPLVNANNAGFISGLQIQNAGTASTDVTVSYTPSLAGTACTETRTIAAGASETFALFAFNNGDSSTCAAGAQFVGSAAVTSNSTNQPLVGIGNQLLPGVNGEAYGSFSASDATGTVVFPLIMDRNGGFFTGFNVVNVGTVATDVNCTFTNSSVTVSETGLAPGAAMTDLQKDKISDGYVGSGTCTASAAGAKIVGVANQLGSSSSNDQFLVYEGVNK